MKRYATIVDCETDGLREDCQVIQLAAIAVDLDTWRELSSFERKVQFGLAKEGESRFEDQQKALKINHYDPEIWKAEAQPRDKVIALFTAWAREYQSLQMTSKAGKPYTVGKLIGHNIVAFDLGKIRRMFGPGFFPFSYQTPDTLQLAMWFFDLQPSLERPANLKLTTLAEYFAIATDGAHDALTDVRLSAAVALAIRNRLFPRDAQ